MKTHQTLKFRYVGLNYLMHRYNAYTEILRNMDAGLSASRAARKSGYSTPIAEHLRNNATILDKVEQELLSAYSFYQGMRAYLKAHPELKTQLTSAQYANLNKKIKKNQQYITKYRRSLK